MEVINGHLVHSWIIPLITIIVDKCHRHVVLCHSNSLCHDFLSITLVIAQVVPSISVFCDYVWQPEICHALRKALVCMAFTLWSTLFSDKTFIILFEYHDSVI